MLDRQRKFPCKRIGSRNYRKKPDLWTSTVDNDTEWKNTMACKGIDCRQALSSKKCPEALVETVAQKKMYKLVFKVKARTKLTLS